MHCSKRGTGPLLEICPNTQACSLLYEQKCQSVLKQIYYSDMTHCVCEREIEMVRVVRDACL